MANVNINFNHYGITAVINNEIIDLDRAALLTNAGDFALFRNAVRTEIFENVAEPTYTDSSNTTTFDLSFGSVTIPTELVDTVGLATVESKLSSIDTRMVAMTAGTTATEEAE